jgi:hypothetical protein
MKNNIVDLPLVFWKNIVYSDPKREKHPEEKPISMVINSRNDTTENMNVTTNSINFYNDTMEVKNKYDEKYPLLLIQFQEVEPIIKIKQSLVLTNGFL